MAKRVHTPAKHQPTNPKPHKRPRPRGWHEWLREARREAEGGKHPHGKAVVRAEKPKKQVRKTYTRRQWARMSTEERLLIIAERLGIVEVTK